MGYYWGGLEPLFKACGEPFLAIINGFLLGTRLAQLVDDTFRVLYNPLDYFELSLRIATVYASAS